MIGALFTISTLCTWSRGTAPPGIVLSDGRDAACNLDRERLAPGRANVITQDRLITIASEVGIWDYAPDEVVERLASAPANGR